MKKYLLIALASLFAFASCSKESNETPEINGDKTVNLTFTSKRPQLKSESKTAWDGTTVVWSTGDKIRIGYTLDGNWMGRSESGTAKFYSSNAVAIDENNSSIGTFNVPINSNSFVDPETSGAYIFYGYYPAAANSNSDQSSAPEVSLDLPWSQTPGAETFDGTADIMIGKTEALTLEGLPTDPIEITWSRLVAHADLTFKNLAFVGTETVSSITLTANDYLAGTFTANLSNGTISSGTTNKVVLGGANLTTSNNSVEAWCCILPVTITSLDVVIVTNKAKYTRSITGISKTFKQNARNKLAINMATAERVEESAVYSLFSGSLVEGDYVIVYDGGAMKNTIVSNRLGYSDITITNDKITNPDPSIVWHIAPSESYWTIYNADVEMFAASVSNDGKAQLLADGTDQKSLWIVEEKSSATKYDFKNLAYQTRYLRRNGTYGFATYPSTGGPLSLYKLGDGGSVTPTSTIAEVLSGGAGTYEVENALVYAVKGSGLIIGDATGKMYAYKSSHGLSVGDVRTVNGTTKIYNEVYEFDGPTFSGSGTATVNHGTAVEFDNVASTLQTDFANPHTAVYVHATGTQSGRNITTTGGNVLYLSAAETTTDGKGVEIYGYVYAYSTSYNNFNIMVISIEVDDDIASLNVNPTSLAWSATETDNKIITVEVNDNASGYSISPTTSSDWNISKNGNTITVSPKAANTSTTTDKTLTLTITHNDDSSLSKVVTCTQSKAPSGGNVVVLNENFSSITTGNSTSTSGSSSAWVGNDNFPTVTRAYQAGGAVKIGSGSNTGSITSKALDLSKSFTVSVDIKGWSSVEGKIKITVGSTEKEITYSEKMSEEFGTYTVDFDAATSSSTITIATSAKRAFIDNIVVTRHD